eukprot:444773-Prymnesium_polylepis.1
MRSRVGRAGRAAAHRAGITPATTRVWRCAVPHRRRRAGRLPLAAISSHREELLGKTTFLPDSAQRCQLSLSRVRTEYRGGALQRDSRTVRYTRYSQRSS